MTVKGDISLGDVVQHSLTPLKGTVIAITNWINGCQRVVVQPRELHDGRPVDGSTIDVEEAILISRPPGRIVPPTGGGGRPDPVRR